jgi:hypothetical protein
MQALLMSTHVRQPGERQGQAFAGSLLNETDR